MVKNYPSSLVALPIDNLLWSDWGTASRIMDVLAKIGKVPRLEGSRRSTGKKIASGYDFLENLLFNGRDFPTSQVVGNSLQK